MTKSMFENKWIKEIQDDISRKYLISLRILGSEQFIEVIGNIYENPELIKGGK